MFHTKLSRVTCKSLLQEVSQTSFPFNCAHGRPSIAPLAMLKHRPTVQHIVKGAEDTARSQTPENDSSPPAPRMVNRIQGNLRKLHFASVCN